MHAPQALVQGGGCRQSLAGDKLYSASPTRIGAARARSHFGRKENSFPASTDAGSRGGNRFDRDGGICFRRLPARQQEPGAPRIDRLKFRHRTMRLERLQRLHELLDRRLHGRRVGCHVTGQGVEMISFRNVGLAEGGRVRRHPRPNRVLEIQVNLGIRAGSGRGRIGYGDPERCDRYAWQLNSSGGL